MYIRMFKAHRRSNRMLLHEASASYKTLNDQLSNDIPSQVAAIKFYFVLAGRAYFLLAPKETKVPARNFSMEVSRWAGSVPSRKIDHAGLRAERRNSGLALLDVYTNRYLRIAISLLWRGA